MDAGYFPLNAVVKTGRRWLGGALWGEACSKPRCVIYAQFADFDSIQSVLLCFAVKCFAFARWWRGERVILGCLRGRKTLSACRHLPHKGGERWGWPLAPRSLSGRAISASLLPPCGGDGRQAREGVARQNANRHSTPRTPKPRAKQNLATVGGIKREGQAVCGRWYWLSGCPPARSPRFPVRPTRQERLSDRSCRWIIGPDGVISPWQPSPHAGFRTVRASGSRPGSQCGDEESMAGWCGVGMRKVWGWG